jgi:hypothetical protein
VFNSSDSLQNNFKKVKEHFYYQKEMTQYISRGHFFLIICSGTGCITVKSSLFFMMFSFVVLGLGLRHCRLKKD